MKNINYKTLSIVLAIGLILSLMASFKFYKELEVYNINKEEFTEYQKNKVQQQEKLQKLLQDNEKMLRDITEITNLEKKLRRAIIRDVDSSKLGSGLSLGTEAPYSSPYSAQGGNGSMTGISALKALEAQNKNIEIMLTDTKRSVSELLGEIEGRNGTLAAFPSQWPTEGGTISSSYGSRMDPIASGKEWHDGIDIAADFGSPVFASGSGTVEVSDWNGGYGRYIRIDHHNGYKTAYGHMSALLAPAGKKVAKGEIIGLIGSTGYSTGPHLHFEVTAEGQSIDPYFVLKK